MRARAGTVGEHGDDGPNLEERRSLEQGTVATGATDEVIARTFGWSIRTVQRHLHEIMRQVGAQTRSRPAWKRSAAAGCESSPSA